MKFTRYLLLLAALAFVLTPLAHAQKKKVAITKIAAMDALTKRMQKQGVSLSLDSVLQALDSQVYDRLLNTRRFEILERSDADALAQEAGAAGEAFNFNMADYILTIRVDSFNDRMEERRLASLGKTIRARTVEMSAVAKVTEVKTQRAVASANFRVSKRDAESRSSNTTQRVGEGSDDLLIQAVSEMAQKIAIRVADVVSPARILAKRGQVVTINRSDEAGVKRGQIWEVMVIGDELVDPDTGEVTMEEVYVGEVEIVRVTSRNSQAKIIEDLGVDRGAIVRLLKDVEDQ